MLRKALWQPAPGQVLSGMYFERSVAVAYTACPAPLQPKGIRHNIHMPNGQIPKRGMPPGVLPMLILRVLQSDPLHGYAIAQRIHLLSSEILAVEEGLLYPTLQKMLRRGWVEAEWGISETNRKVRFYRLTAKGKAQLRQELACYGRMTQAIKEVLRTA